MTRDDIIRMAREAGWSELGTDLWGTTNDGVMFTRALQRFAALVAAAEREACAVAVQDFEFEFQDDSVGSLLGAANAIRARGQA